MAGFAICVAGGLACFMISFFVGVPLLWIKPSKFATSFTLGSILLMARYFYTHRITRRDITYLQEDLPRKNWVGHG